MIKRHIYWKRIYNSGVTYMMLIPNPFIGQLGIVIKESRLIQFDYSDPTRVVLRNPKKDHPNQHIVNIPLQRNGGSWKLQFPMEFKRQKRFRLGTFVQMEFDFIHNEIVITAARKKDEPELDNDEISTSSFSYECSSM